MVPSWTTPQPTATPTDQAFSCANVTEIPQIECDALVALYKSTNGANWTNHTSWLVTLTPCSWFGVICNNNRLTKLNLSGNLLIGSIPSQLGNLANLQELSLGNNQLSGNIPAQLSNLTNLQYLDLSENQLSGALPSSLINLAKLSIFWFNSTSLCEPSDAAFQAWLTHLTHLQSTGVKCTAPPPIDAAELVAQGDYTTVGPGESAQFWINIRNSGNTTWRASTGYGWRGTGEWAARTEQIWRDVPPGDVLSFSQAIIAPSQPDGYTYGFILQHAGQDFGPHFFIKITVQFLPVVLVHGWNDKAASWNDYLTFLSSRGLTGNAVSSMYTGSGGGTPWSIDQNAQS